MTHNDNINISQCEKRLNGGNCMVKNGFIHSIAKIGKNILPDSLKQAIKQSIGYSTENLDVYFRICSPATPPELAQCLFELHQDGLLEGKDYYEFGLFRGYALWFVQDMIRRLGVSNIHFHGF